VVKYLILGHNFLSFELSVEDFLDIVSIVKGIKFLKQDYTVLILIYFLKKTANFFRFQTQVKVFT